MDKFLESFAKIPSSQKLLGTLIVVLVILGGTFLLGVQESLGRISDAEGSLEAQAMELGNLNQKAQNRMKFMREVERLRLRLREAEEQLPKQAEVEKLLRDIAYEAQQSGLQMDRFELQAEETEGDFARVPVKMTVRGGYHEIAVFLDRLSKMSRIVNVNDLVMEKPRLENKKIVLSSQYLATTYRFLEKPKKKKKSKRKRAGRR